MDYTIKPITAGMAETFAGYLENLDFSHAPHWATCYCRYYYSDCPHQEWMEISGEQNREDAVAKIREGSMQGYLAFDGDKCIGWCSSNDARSFIRLKADISHLIQDKKTGCVICFVIHPEYRERGIARLLLKRAVEDFKINGFDAVLALPFKLAEAPQKQYRGTFNMYTELGFRKLEKHGDVSIMWLEL